MAGQLHALQPARAHRDWRHLPNVPHPQPERAGTVQWRLHVMAALRVRADHAHAPDATAGRVLSSRARLAHCEVGRSRERCEACARRRGLRCGSGECPPPHRPRHHDRSTELPFNMGLAMRSGTLPVSGERVSRLKPSLEREDDRAQRLRLYRSTEKTSSCVLSCNVYK
jgi:hypothetical protein|eukprot:3932897-Prymnesium_polylepis.2